MFSLLYYCNEIINYAHIMCTKSHHMHILIGLKRITKEVLDDAANDNVAYIELRTCPKLYQIH